MQSLGFDKEAIQAAKSARRLEQQRLSKQSIRRALILVTRGQKSVARNRSVNWDECAHAACAAPLTAGQACARSPQPRGPRPSS